METTLARVHAPSCKCVPVVAKSLQLAHGGAGPLPTLARLCSPLRGCVRLMPGRRGAAYTPCGSMQAEAALKETGGHIGKALNLLKYKAKPIGVSPLFS